MKKCLYCGKEYPDDATACVVDGGALSGGVVDEKKFTGVWRGVHGYGERKTLAGMEPVRFTLKLKQGWMGHFTGSVREDPPQGMPGMGVVDGHFNSKKIEFAKQMPVGYATGPDGLRMTLREYFLEGGHPCEHELPASPVFYQGTFLDKSRMQGTWIINPRRIPLSDGSLYSTGRTCGFWCAEFVTTDIKIDPTSGPTGALFDKSLLLPRELEDVEAVSLRSMGRFSVVNALKILTRFQQENIRYEINRDDTAIHQMRPVVGFMGGYYGMAKMIEVFVPPENVTEAEAIINEDARV